MWRDRWIFEAVIRAREDNSIRVGWGDKGVTNGECRGRYVFVRNWREVRVIDDERVSFSNWN